MNFPWKQRRHHFISYHIIFILLLFVDNILFSFLFRKKIRFESVIKIQKEVFLETHYFFISKGRLKGKCVCYYYLSSFLLQCPSEEYKGTLSLCTMYMPCFIALHFGKGVSFWNLFGKVGDSAISSTFQLYYTKSISCHFAVNTHLF